MSDFTGVRHVGWGVKDPIALAKFYEAVLGMTVVAQTPANSRMGVTVFLSRHPEAEGHHDLVLFSNPMFAHTAFRVDDLDEFLAFYQEVKTRGVPVKFTFNHGVWFSFYFDDPEGHNLEIYWPTYANAPQDYQPVPLNLDQPKEALLAVVEKLVEQFGRLAPAGTVQEATPRPASAPQSTPNPAPANAWNASQGSANQWGANQGGTDQWSGNQGGASQWSGTQGGGGQGNMSDWNPRVIAEFRANGGKVAMLPTPVMLITTTGRKSGKPHTNPVGYMTDGDRLIAVPSSPTADWYLNVLANPQVKVELGTETFMATATLVEGEPQQRFLQRARQVAAAAASAWRPADAGDMAEHVAEDGPVVALQRIS